jgi:DNA/RNA-binding domain of Phe-tRNA-synthetase-like protein
MSLSGFDGGDEAVPDVGWVAPALTEEFPGLAVRVLVIEGGARSSPRPVRARLADLANRFSGAKVVNLRHQPIPWAYRVFFRHVGLDPDTNRTPVEDVALERMKHGGFHSENIVSDALTIAVAESGVALQAFDADRLEGRVGIRASAPGEVLPGRITPLEAGTLVLADESRPIAFLFGQTSTDHAVAKRTKRTALVAVQVQGVPDISVEEAMWLAAGVMRS